MANLTVLHLSDLHFGGDWNPVESAKRKGILDSLIETVGTLEPEWRPDCVLISGDIGYRGAKSDFEVAETWLQKLLSRLNLTFEAVFTCPGNHDVDRKTAAKVPRPTSCQEADEVLALPLAAHFELPFAEYVDFCGRTKIPPYSIGNSTSYLIGQRTYKGLRVVSVNSAWFCKDNADKSKLWIGLPHLQYMDGEKQLSVLKRERTPSPVTICMLHHPREWLCDDEIHAFSLRPNTLDYLAHRCHLLLTGHTHGEVRRADKIAESAWHITAGASYAGASHFNSFRLIRVESDQFVYRTFEFDPRSADTMWRDPFGANLLAFIHSTGTDNSPTPAESGSDLTMLRNAAVRDAEALIVAKSRQIKTTGLLPEILPLSVMTRVTEQVAAYDREGNLLSPKHTESELPLYDMCRRSRKTVLLGDLGSGKSTLAGRFVLETLQRNDNTLAFVVPAKALNLGATFLLQELLDALDAYVFGQIAPTVPRASINALLKAGVETTLVFDGLDELPKPLIPHFIRQIAALVEHWPNVQLLATGRPVELRGVSYDSWQLCRPTRLNERDKQELFVREATAEGLDGANALVQARRRSTSLKQNPSLDSLANTPLAARLLYRKLDPFAQSQTAPTLGDLLVELLIERLGGWAERDSKPSSHAQFEKSFPTGDSKAALLGALALGCGANRGAVEPALARQLLNSQLGGTSLSTDQLTEEALAFFQQCGVIAIEPRVEFIFQPLNEVAAGLAILQSWVDTSRSTVTLDKSHWRMVSFAAALARQRGMLEKVRHNVLHYLRDLLQEIGGVAAACYVAGESKDVAVARFVIEHISKLDRRPLYWNPDEEAASSRAIASTITLAGDQGFNWLFESYLDPRYPIVNRGSAIILSVVRHWASLIQDNLTKEQTVKLSTLVAPQLAHPSTTSFLNELVVLVPKCFDANQRLWILSGMLDDSLFGEGARSAVDGMHANGHRDIVNEALRRRSKDAVAAATRYLHLNSGVPPAQVLKGMARAASRRTTDPAIAEAIQSCAARLGRDRFQIMLRWFLTDSDAQLAAGAALLLHDAGDIRLFVLGPALFGGLHDGGRVRGAEEILSQLIENAGKKGVRWLANAMCDRPDAHFGAHSGAWRLLLKWVHLAEVDGPAILTGCMSALGPFLLPRYPEVRFAFQEILADATYHSAMRACLWDFDPAVRLGAALVLATCDPKGEAEAVYVAIQSRPFTHLRSYYEWEEFLLSLGFSYSVLEYLHGKLTTLNQTSRPLALALLARHDYPLAEEERAELLRWMLDRGNWFLREADLKATSITSAAAFDALLDRLKELKGERSHMAAEDLLRYHSGKLSAHDEAMCWLLIMPGHIGPRQFVDQMAKTLNDSSFRQTVIGVAEDYKKHSGREPFLGMVAATIDEPTRWKEVIWAALCSSPGIDGDQGECFLEFVRTQPAYASIIGPLATHMLDDPRLQTERWTDQFHWLALIADECARLPRPTLENVLLAGTPIWGSATRSLLARYGVVPPGLPLRDGGSRIPTLSNASQPASRDGLIAKIHDCALPAERLHPDTCPTIEQLLLHPALPEEQLKELGLYGHFGALIAEALRFCFGRPTLVEIRLSTLKNPFLSREQANDKCIGRLHSIQNQSHHAALDGDPVACAAYVHMIHEELKTSSSWSTLLVSELFEHSRDFPSELIEGVFSDYAHHHGHWHDRLGRQLTGWLASRETKETRTDIVQAAHQAVEILDTTAWDANADGIRQSPLPYLIFPLAVWTFTGRSTSKCDQVFLRGIVFSYQRMSRDDAEDPAETFGIIEPLLRLAPRELLAQVLKKGAAFPHPAVRAFATLAFATSPSRSVDCS